MHSDLLIHLQNSAPTDRFAAHAAAPEVLDVPAEEPALVLRRATPADAPALRRLAALDSAEPLGDDVLIAFADDEPIAALALVGDRVAADPFHRTADAVALLRLRARHLLEERSERPARRRRALHLTWG